MERRLILNMRSNVTGSILLNNDYSVVVLWILIVLDNWLRLILRLEDHCIYSNWLKRNVLIRLDLRVICWLILLLRNVLVREAYRWELLIMLLLFLRIDLRLWILILMNSMLDVFSFKKYLSSRLVFVEDAEPI
jgi:hypothetical protein